ncbi:carbamoyltransferase HypF [Calidifontibacillus oryziterrae]|uniref:carbamoyltransferase HypF n=1 Tax=Calidifontibacillus oryziterrae TaxID=1191699 RepID=UPI0002D99C98|nr:carbamoyltransferase HypF [Calidifontibacillus oryziterrae]
MPEAILIKVKGRVQGVGFRPFVFQLAEKYKVTGTVQNNMDGVRIIAEGNENSLENLVNELKTNAPRLSRIDSILVEDVELNGFTDFSIIASERSGASSLVIPIDASVCEDCLNEMNDPANFRYLYPFINCTQCGPRYTIIEALPYDRPYTVMKDFVMCDKCRKEYEDPTNRRHHAQPIACPECGPKVILYSIDRKEVASESAAITAVKEKLTIGEIVAIKGIGGYHLVCDAKNEQAINLLRQRKSRPQKPLAIMAKNIEAVRKVCAVNEREEEAITSTAAPIVVLQKNRNEILPDELAPGINTLGMMLPYTPLHHLLFSGNSLEFLVVTSANPSGLPMLYKDEEAFHYLEDIADYVLTADRKIIHPIDDSVVQIINNKLTFLRRARGFVPDPLITDKNIHGVVSLGPQQKNTFAIGRNEEIFVGPHIGDMNHYEMTQHYKRELKHLMKWLGPFTKPILAIDKHPSYAVRDLIRNFRDSDVIEIQHHHAHHVSCMVDNHLNDSCFGIILDGTGYGEDGNIWGFEVLYGDAKGYKRLAHLRYSPLPGGEKAIKEPWRNAVAMLIEYLGNEGKELAGTLFPEKSYEIEIISNMVVKNLNSPLAGTCGRLFDAVSAILGICTVQSYDGEAAIKLSEIVPFNASCRGDVYPYELKDDCNLLEIDFSSCLKGIITDYLKGRDYAEIVQAFHETVVHSCVDSIVKLANHDEKLNRSVVLSGGSFHNPFLAREIKRMLELKGFRVFIHSRVPCNDGGLSLGQLMIATANRTNG